MKLIFKIILFVFFLHIMGCIPSTNTNRKLYTSSSLGPGGNIRSFNGEGLHCQVHNKIDQSNSEVVWEIAENKVTGWVLDFGEYEIGHFSIESGRFEDGQTDFLIITNEKNILKAKINTSIDLLFVPGRSRHNDFYLELNLQYGNGILTEWFYEIENDDYVLGLLSNTTMEFSNCYQVINL